MGRELSGGLAGEISGAEAGNAGNAGEAGEAEAGGTSKAGVPLTVYISVETRQPVDGRERVSR